MNILKYNLIIIILLLLVAFNGCTNKNKKTNKNIIAEIGEEKIELEKIDSLLNDQIYEIRLNALENEISKKLLEIEAKKQNISLEKLVNTEINKKAKTVTGKELSDYIIKSDFNFNDTSKLKNYLIGIKQKERQSQYVDSLKNIYKVKVFLKPTYFNVIDTKSLYAHNLNENNSKVTVYIISDFRCSSCQETEKTLRKIYNKYNNKIKFAFIYYSGYIDKDALACEAAEKQNKFRKMHDIIFENSDLLSNDSIYYEFAKKIGLDLNKFKLDMQDKSLLKPLLNNKDFLIANQIYTTPSFIVNNKVLNRKYAINYLEEIIDEELEKYN